MLFVDRAQVTDLFQISEIIVVFVFAGCLHVIDSSDLLAEHLNAGLVADVKLFLHIPDGDELLASLDARDWRRLLQLSWKVHKFELKKI